MLEEQTISHYRILQKIGEGGMGIVYKAQDLQLDRCVALKFLPPNHCPLDRTRFIIEAKTASAIDHPNICTIHEIGEAPDGRIFIVMACCKGIELSKKIRVSPVELAEALDIAVQAADGLRAAHEKGIIHRDIKSNNILISEGCLQSPGRVKIIDFGLAKCAGLNAQTEDDSISGTDAYMSPEQVRGERVDQRTDIWSLGVVLYEMLTGRVPFKSEYHEATLYLILNQDPPAMSSFRAEIPSELERIVAKCLEKKPADRYQNMEEMLADLRNEQNSLRYWRDDYQRIAKRNKMEPPTFPRRIWLAASIVTAFVLLPLIPGSSHLPVTGTRSNQVQPQSVKTEIQGEYKAKSSSDLDPSGISRKRTTMHNGIETERKMMVN